MASYFPRTKEREVWPQHVQLSAAWPSRGPSVDCSQVCAAQHGQPTLKHVCVASSESICSETGASQPGCRIFHSAWHHGVRLRLLQCPNFYQMLRGACSMCSRAGKHQQVKQNFEREAGSVVCQAALNVGYDMICCNSKVLQSHLQFDDTP